MVSHSDECVEQLCSRLIYDYAYYVDHWMADEVAELFVSQGCWKSSQFVLRSQTEIREFQKNRPRNVVSRHLCTNIRVHSLSASRAEADSYVTLYRGPVGDTGASPNIAVALMGEFRDLFVLTDVGWRFAERELRLSFEDRG